MGECLWRWTDTASVCIFRLCNFPPCHLQTMWGGVSSTVQREKQLSSSGVLPLFVVLSITPALAVTFCFPSLLCRVAICHGHQSERLFGAAVGATPLSFQVCLKSIASRHCPASVLLTLGHVQSHRRRADFRRWNAGQLVLRAPCFSQAPARGRARTSGPAPLLDNDEPAAKIRQG